MILKNLTRRAARTLLTVLGIAVGVMAIITLGALGAGLQAGYTAVLVGSQADYTISDPGAMDVIMSSVDLSVPDDLRQMQEVEEVAGMIQGMTMTSSSPYFFLFSYEPDTFPLERFKIQEGISVFDRDAVSEAAPYRPLMLGKTASDSLKIALGDRVTLATTEFKVVGIYDTGDAFEGGGGVSLMDDARTVLGLDGAVSQVLLRVKSGTNAAEFEERIARRYPDLLMKSATDASENNTMVLYLNAMVGIIAGLAILIGGISMTNSQLMSVYERTREIGVLRAVGWRRGRVIRMILGESLIVSVLGGIIGTGLAWLTLDAFAPIFSAYGADSSLELVSVLQAFGVVLVLGILGGLYPAIRAAQLLPVEALRYDGSSGEDAGRLPVGGMALQNLWRRKFRTLLTLGVVGLTIGSVAVMAAVVVAGETMMTGIVGEGVDIVVRQAGAADTGLAFIDERVGYQLNSLDEVDEAVGMAFTAVMWEDEATFFMILGYYPHQIPGEDYTVIEGRKITRNGEVMVGQSVAESLNIHVGENISLGSGRYHVTGIYQAKNSWQEFGGVFTMKDAQTFTGREDKVSFYFVDLHDPTKAEAVVDAINTHFTEVEAGLSEDLVDQLPDMDAMRGMSDAVTFVAILIGGVGIMNTMLMSVMERTREIGVLRALGWRKRAVLGMILREAIILGLIGGVVGLLVALGMVGAMNMTYIGDLLTVEFTPDIYLQSFIAAFILSLIGGLLPAFRATRMHPVEALRYE